VFIFPTFFRGLVLQGVERLFPHIRQVARAGHRIDGEVAGQLRYLQIMVPRLNQYRIHWQKNHAGRKSNRANAPVVFTCLL
jgi:hypothetical protein